jgi:hypothetical protein
MNGFLGKKMEKASLENPRLEKLNLHKPKREMDKKSD